MFVVISRRSVTSNFETYETKMKHCSKGSVAVVATPLASTPKSPPPSWQPCCTSPGQFLPTKCCLSTSNATSTVAPCQNDQLCPTRSPDFQLLANFVVGAVDHIFQDHQIFNY